MPLSRTGMRLNVRTFRVPMFVIAAALIGLIAALATLQYRWLGRISDAERERMTANLGAHTTSLAQEFDHELTRAYATFQMDLLTGDENIAAKLAARNDHWIAKARYPRMVRNVYIARQEDDVQTLRRFVPASKFVEPVEWPEALAPVREALGKASGSPVSGSPEPGGSRPLPNTFFFTSILPQALDQVPALVIPMPVVFINTLEARPMSTPAHRLAFDGTAAYVIVHLDRDYITQEMLPAMVEQRFRSAGTAYQVAVVSQTSKGVVYTSDREFAPGPKTPADATADFFQVRQQEFGQLVSEIRRYTSSAIALPRPIIPGRTPQGEPRSGVAQSIEVHRLEASPQTVVTNPQMSITLQQSLGARERAAIVGGTSTALARTVQAVPRWRLVVQHPSGSLEAAVNSARRRNIMVSSSVMALLGVSVGFLIITTRRAQELARQQMEFVAAVSHELRTPLAVIRSAADNLAEGVVHDPPQVKKYGDLVRVEGRRLSEMVEQILELAGIESGQRSFALGPVPVLPLLHDVVRASSTLIDDARIEVELDVPEIAAAGVRRGGRAATRLPESHRQRDQVRRQRPLDRGHGAARRPRDRRHDRRPRDRHSRRRAVADLRSVLPRAERRRRPDPGRRPRPQPRPAHRRGARRPHQRAKRRGPGQRVHGSSAGSL